MRGNGVRGKKRWCLLAQSKTDGWWIGAGRVDAEGF